MIYSKTLDLADYDLLPIAHILGTRDRLHALGAVARFEHQHRAWEYGIIMKALLDKGSKDILDVGGGASVFAPAYTTAGDHEVTQVDAGIEMHWLPAQERALGIYLPYHKLELANYIIGYKKTHDSVVSISTIEHVPDDFAFYAEMCGLVKPGGLLAITFDFHPSGEQLLQGHLRTYNYERIQDLIGIAEDKGFIRYGDGMDYSWRGEFVNNYTFGSLVMEREE